MQIKSSFYTPKIDLCSPLVIDVSGIFYLSVAENPVRET